MLLAASGSCRRAWSFGLRPLGCSPHQVVGCPSAGGVSALLPVLRLRMLLTSSPARVQVNFCGQRLRLSLVCSHLRSMDFRERFCSRLGCERHTLGLYIDALARLGPVFHSR